MGSPQNPSPEQIATLEKAGQLQLHTSPKWINTKGQEVINISLPRQAISLLKFVW